MLDCVNCGGDVGFNRVVIDLSTGSEAGGLCQTCEREEFGIILEDNLWHHDTGCALCMNDGEYSLPLMDCRIEYESRPDTVEYTITEETISLCKRHLKTLTEPPLSEETTAKSDPHMTT